MIRFHRSRIALMELFGIIGSGARMAQFIKLFEAARDSRRIKAVVLDIDSPGGLATTSQHLYLSVSRLAARKPVVAFIRGSGTSGAYMAASAATKIVALPSAMVGSIGVISLRPLFPGLLQRIGVKMNVTKGGHLKDMGAFYREPTDEETQKEQALVDELYNSFIAIVASGRKMEPEKVRQLATGEVFTAVRGKELGLVDELGDLEYAIQLAASLARIPPRTIMLRLRRPFLERLLSPSLSALSDEVASQAENLLSRRIYFLG